MAVVKSRYPRGSDVGSAGPPANRRGRRFRHDRMRARRPPGETTPALVAASGGWTCDQLLTPVMPLPMPTNTAACCHHDHAGRPAFVSTRPASPARVIPSSPMRSRRSSGVGPSLLWPSDRGEDRYAANKRSCAFGTRASCSNARAASQLGRAPRQAERGHRRRHGRVYVTEAITRPIVIARAEPDHPRLGPDGRWPIVDSRPAHGLFAWITRRDRLRTRLHLTDLRQAETKVPSRSASTSAVSASRASRAFAASTAIARLAKGSPSQRRCWSPSAPSRSRAAPRLSHSSRRLYSGYAGSRESGAISADAREGIRSPLGSMSPKYQALRIGWLATVKLLSAPQDCSNAAPAPHATRPIGFRCVSVSTSATDLKVSVFSTTRTVGSVPTTSVTRPGEMRRARSSSYESTPAAKRRPCRRRSSRRFSSPKISRERSREPQGGASAPRSASRRLTCRRSRSSGCCGGWL
jgi:hypothetical protein